MAKILDMPKLSPTMEEGVLATWHKKEGDSVEVDDLLAEVETDKATMEFRAFDKGTLLKLLVEAGATVKLGQPVAILGKAGEDVSDLAAEAGGGGDAGEDAAKAEKPKAKKAKAKAPADDDDADADAEDDDAEDEEGADADEDADADADADEDADADDDAEDDADAEDEETDEEDEEADDGEATKAKPTKAKPSTAKANATKAKPEPKASRPSPTMRPPVPQDRGSLLTRTERDAAPEAKPASPSDGRVLASPYVRKVARERGINLATAQGSGEHGRIVPSDLDALKQPAQTKKEPAQAKKSSELARTAPAALATPALAAPEVRPLSPMRKTIARRLTQSKQTVPHFYLTIDVDAEELVSLRERINVELAAGVPAKPGADAPKPEKISLNDLIIKASAVALVRVPECNAQFTEEAILVHKRVDVSVAVAIPDGLVTPIVRNADQKSVVAIAREVRDLAARARTKKLKPEEMSDGTFSISNLGMFGIDAFSAVINPPEGAILAVGQVRDEPVVKDGQVKPGKRLALTLSCDHRVVDGAVGAAFLAELRALLERPMRVLTG